MRQYLLLSGLVVCSVLSCMSACFADRTPSSCFDRHNAGATDFDFTVYFKHDFPKSKSKGGLGSCGAGKRQDNARYSQTSYINEDGCCGKASICQDNGKTLCCLENANYTTEWDYLKTVLESNANGDCGKRLYNALQAIPVGPDTRILLIATADKTGKDAYNRDLAERRLSEIKQLFNAEQQSKILYINGGESNDNFTKVNGRNVDERTVRIIIAGEKQIETIRTEIQSHTSVTTNTTITIKNGDLDASRTRINTIANSLKGLTGNLETSVWKNKEGSFNTARLLSDSVAGVVLGTAGGLITSNIVKRNQIKGGFEDIKCTIGGQVVAEFKDDFRVGLN